MGWSAAVLSWQDGWESSTLQSRALIALWLPSEEWLRPSSRKPCWLCDVMCFCCPVLHSSSSKADRRSRARLGKDRSEIIIEERGNHSLFCVEKPLWMSSCSALQLKYRLTSMLGQAVLTRLEFCMKEK